MKYVKNQNFVKSKRTFFSESFTKERRGKSCPIQKKIINISICFFVCLKMMNHLQDTLYFKSFEIIRRE